MPAPLPRYRNLLGLTLNGPKLGEMAGQTAGAENQVRGYLLASLIKQGKLKQQNLSAQDLSLAAPKLGQVNQGPGFLGKVWGGFENLGADIADAAKGLPEGVVNMGSAVVNDVLSGNGGIMGSVPAQRGKGSQVQSKVIDPTVQSYEYTYLGKGAPAGSSLLGRIYQHPLGPILDAASIASLGLGTVAKGASVASKAGVAAQPGSRLHSLLLSTERDPIVAARLPESHVAEGETVPTIPREYSTRPLRRTLQYGTDKLADVPYVGRPVEALQGRFAQTHRQRSDFSQKELKGNVIASREAIEPLVPLLNKLSPEEVAAVPLIGMRINSPQLLQLYQDAVHEGLRGEAPEGQNAPSAVIRELPESRANLSDRTKELAADPTQSPALMAFLSEYTDRLASRVYPDVGDDVQKLVDSPRAALLERFGRNAPEDVPEVDLTDPEGYSNLSSALKEQKNSINHPFAEGFLVPTQVSRDVRYSQPGLIGRMFGKEPGFELGRRRTFNPHNVGYQDLFRTPYMGMKPDVDAVLSGAVRPDPRQFVDYLTKHERDKIETAFNEDMIAQQAVKDADGNPVKVPGNWTIDKVQQEFGPDFVPVNPDIPWHFYNKEFTVGQAVSKMEAAGLDVSEIMARVGQEAEDMGIDATLAAQRTPNVVVPKKFADYQLGLAQAHRPYDHAGTRTLARAMNFWRTYTLTYMPRWALNTAVGSFVLATVKGISPRQYYIAQRLRSLVGGEQKLKLGKDKGFFDKPEMAGVNLASIASWDMLEMGAMGHADALNLKTGFITRQVMRNVQQIEDHFRRASFVQSLDKRARQSLNEQGAIIRGLEESRGPRTVEEYARYVSENPEMVQKAIEDLNKFSYNFATLGPFERRYVRQAIPFWGWYKFISGLAYRLPVEYPGRTAIMAQLGELGTNQQEDKYGMTPSWLKGALGLTEGPKNFKYLSTMGLNPFSQIFNPMGPEGPIGGSLQLSQGSPLIQALLTAYGVDPMRGGEVPISPETLAQSRVGRDFFGSLVSYEGQEKDPWQVAGGRRLLASILRSFPYTRIVERQQAGGRSSFPESLPWAPRPMATRPESRFGGAGSEVLEQLIGVAPRPYNLKGWQQLAPKRGDYAKTRNRTDLRKLRRNLKRP
jgi:hypothetical protein